MRKTQNILRKMVRVTETGEDRQKEESEEGRYKYLKKIKN